MKIAFFSTQSYDRDFFNRFNTVHDIVYIEAPLNAQTVQLAQGCAELTLSSDALPLRRVATGSLAQVAVAKVHY
jgi:D-lactate dehydrogenase